MELVISAAYLKAGSKRKIEFLTTNSFHGRYHMNSCMPANLVPFSLKAASVLILMGLSATNDFAASKANPAAAVETAKV